MVTSLLSGWIGLLILLFIVAIVVITIATLRARNAGRKVAASNEPIPDVSRRNYHTRVDKDAAEEEREIRHDNPGYRSAVSQRDEHSRP